MEGETISFAPDRAGLYLVQLEATDGVVIAEPVVLAVVVENATPVAAALGNATTYEYDALERPLVETTPSGQDLLTSASSSQSWSVTFTYDVTQRRTSKTFDNGSGNVVETVYVYDGPNVLFEFRTENGNITSRRWLNSYGLDQRFAFEQYNSATPTPGTGIVYELFTDDLGSIIAVLDTSTNQVVSRYDYDSFGQRTVLFEAIDPGYGFTGQQYDAETGFGYFRTRYYDPKEGRFLSEDPGGFADGHQNLNAYVGNAPYQSVDPYGLAATAPWAMRTADALFEGRSAPGLIAGAANGLLLNAWNFMMDELSGLWSRTAENAPNAGLPTREERNSGCMPINKRPAPGILPIASRTHGGPPHNKAINQRVVFLRAYNIRNLRFKRAPRYWNISKHQRQKNRGGQTVSTCLPDLQYDVYKALHYLEEYFYAPDALATWNKARVMQWADPFAAQLFNIVGRRR